ncbi:MAG: hypothetical protein ACLQQ4_13125 [Bacteroidia bacterium]
MKNKILRSITLVALIMATTLAYSQNVAINSSGTAPSGTAVLDLSQNTTGGFLLPYVTTAEENTMITNGVTTSLLVYNSTDNCIESYYSTTGTFEEVWCPCSGPPNTPAAPTGSTSVCYGTASTTYTVTSVAGATMYIWYLSGTGGSFSVSGTQTQAGPALTATVNWSTSGTYSLTVVAANSCAASTASPALVITDVSHYTQPFYYNGSTQYNGTGQAWTCPCGVSSVTVQLWGAGGGGGAGGDNAGAVVPFSGGGGGYVAGTLNVTAGTTYSVVVGAGGATFSFGEEWVYGGGGPASLNDAFGLGVGTGGGMSAILNSAQTTAYVIAGGGGGAGGAYYETNGTTVITTSAYCYGGAGGSTTAGGTVATWECGGAGGGTQAAGGAGGTGTAAPYHYTAAQLAGKAGGLWSSTNPIGGGGAGSTADAGTTGWSGGGGGGYYGGGGAGCYTAAASKNDTASTDLDSYGYGGPGGGGGSSYVGGLATVTSNLLGNTNTTTGATVTDVYTGTNYYSGTGFLVGSGGCGNCGSDGNPENGGNGEVVITY